MKIEKHDRPLSTNLTTVVNFGKGRPGKSTFFDPISKVGDKNGGDNTPVRPLLFQTKTGKKNPDTRLKTMFFRGFWS
jgi:hypothetical protein